MFPSSEEVSHARRMGFTNHCSALFSSPKIERFNTINRTTIKCKRSSMKLFTTISFLVALLTPSSAFAPVRNFELSNSYRWHMQITASATIDNTPSSYDMSNFSKRMKNLVTRDSRKARNLKANKKAPKNLMRIDTLEDFRKIITNNENEKIVVVRWYAPWCKACKAIAPLFYRLASTFPDAIFVDVPVTPENANLHQGLGVPSLPFGHIYHPAGKLVEELKISRKHFPQFAKVLKDYIDGQCDIDFDQNGMLIDPSNRRSSENLAS